MRQKLLRRMRKMHPMSYHLLRGGMMVAAAFLFAAVMAAASAMHAELQALSALLNFTGELCSAGSAVLFAVVFGTAFLEERVSDDH